MRSLINLAFKASVALLLASAGGCLVSDEPILDQKSGSAAPLAEGEYIACPVKEPDDCARFSVVRGADGVTAFTEIGEDADSDAPAQFRFRRVARKAYAAQSDEGDGYAYYFGKGDSSTFTLVMMNCKSLPAALRASLIRRGDLETESDAFEVCTVKTRAGLVAAAKAYASRAVDLADEPTIVMSRVKGADKD